MVRLVGKLIGALLVAALALSVLPAPPTGAAAPRLDKIDPALQSMMAATPQNRWPVIVEGDFDGPGNGARANADRANRAAARASANNARPKAMLSIIGSASASADYAAITALSRDPSVAYIYYDAPVAAHSDPVANVYEQVIDAPTAWNLGYTGKGVAVAVLDSGINPASDLTQPSNRIVARADFVRDNALVPDPGGHGTHVAGIIAGNGSSAQATSSASYRGVAPEANLVDVRVINGNGQSNKSTVIAGVQWVLAHARTYNIRVMNLSLGSPVPANYSYRTDPLAAALEIAWLAGIVVVTPAGNDGPGGGTIASPGTDPMVITVGAVDDANTVDRSDDTVPSFSSRGPTPDGFAKPDLLAPGRRIVSLRSPGSYLDNLLPERIVTLSNGSSYFRLSGSSMSAGVASGVAALLLQKNPALRPDQVKYVLTHSTNPMAGDASAVGAGVLDAAKALASKNIDQANVGRRPAYAFARAIQPMLTGRPIPWRDSRLGGRDWAKAGAANIFWDKTAWDNIFWDNIFWDNIFWDNIFWDNIFWDNIFWDNIFWDNIFWDNIFWDTARGGRSVVD